MNFCLMKSDQVLGSVCPVSVKDYLALDHHLGRVLPPDQYMFLKQLWALDMPCPGRGYFLVFLCCCKGNQPF